MKFNYWQDFEEGVVYHIYNRSVSEEVLFRDEEDYKNFLIKFEKYFASYLKVYAYCLIPNHFHFLVKVKSEESVLEFVKNENSKAAQMYVLNESTLNDFLIDQFRRFFSSISLAYNSKYNRRGPLISPKTKRVSICTESKLMYLITYIHHNPIHHGLRNNFTDWKYCSYNSYLKNIENSKVEIDEIIEWMGGIDVFLDFHKEFKISMKENLNLD